MIFRKATKKDLPFVMQLIADDALGKHRENYKKPLPSYYLEAFEIINADLN